MKGRAAVALIAVMAVGCTGAPPASIGVAGSTTTPPTAIASATATAAAPTILPTFGPPKPFVPGPAGTILFTRTDVTRGHDSYWEVFPDGSHEIELDANYGTGVWSPDGSTLAFVFGNWDTGVRPGLIRADGAGFRSLAIPQVNEHVVPVGWSVDGHDLFVQLHALDGVPETMPAGLYRTRTLDTGDLIPVVPTPPDHADLFAIAPDGRHILITRVKTDDTDRILLIANADGSQLHQVSSPDPDVQLIDQDWWDDASEVWSPDGTQAAYGAHDVTTDPPVTLFITGLSGKPREIVHQDVGAATVRWSPDGKWLAFTSKFRAGAQVWKVRPDGTGLTQLTFPATGFSIMPIWSPDSSHLLFQRQLVDGGDVWLWTMAADGRAQRQLVPDPLAADLIGGYAWWPPAP